MVAIGAFLYWETLSATGLAFIGTLLGAKSLSVFFASPTGVSFIAPLQTLARAVLLVGLIALTWIIGGSQLAMWLLGGIAGLAGLGLALSRLSPRYQKFSASPRGANTNRTLNTMKVVVLLVCVGTGALWLAGQLPIT